MLSIHSRTSRKYALSESTIPKIVELLLKKYVQ